jgi:transcriptional regulator with XRE-family HTH domain
LAEKVGINDGYIARIEIGAKASFKTLTKIAHALGIKMSDIVKADDELVNTLNEVSDLYGKYDKEFSTLHPTLKSLLLKLAPVIQEYL